MDSEYSTTSSDDDMDELAFNKASLDECLTHLHKPQINRNPPRVCYKKLSFPDDPPTKIPAKQSYQQYFADEFKNLIVISPLKSFDDGRIFVSHNLIDNFKTFKHKKKFTLIPLEHYQTPESLRPDAYIGLLYDNVRDEWEIFRFPGSDIPKNFYLVEQKILKWIKEKLKMDPLSFYQHIYYEPKKNTEHYYYWPSWLIYYKIRYPIEFREQTVNLALEKILKKNQEYKNFIRKFQSYMY